MKTEFNCSLCGHRYFVHGQDARMSRCPNCSSSESMPTKSTNLNMVGSSGERVSVKIKSVDYTCHKCGNFFPYDTTSDRKPYCSKCRSIGQAPKTPRVVVYTGTQNHTSHKIEYSKKATKALHRLDDGINIVEAQLKVLGASAIVVNEVRNVLLRERRNIVAHIDSVSEKVPNV